MIGERISISDIYANAHLKFLVIISHKGLQGIPCLPKTAVSIKTIPTVVHTMEVICVTKEFVCVICVKDRKIQASILLNP